jgi:hypothetical protein
VKSPTTALELLPRDAADRGLAVGVDIEVDGPPPLGIRAGVSQRIEHRLLRRVDVHSSMNA